MRKFIIAAALAATLTPAAGMAQSWREVRESRQDVREDRRDLRAAQRYGDRGDIRAARRDLRDSRQEARGDWRDWRRTHPDVYRGPAYAPPRAGWRYRPVAVGYRFEPAYYGQRYWIDPVRYRLPAARPNTRWVRYGNDVALVNVRTGRVVDIHGGFFY